MSTGNGIGYVEMIARHFGGCSLHALLGELRAERRKAKRRKTTAARRNDVQAADEAQTDEAALEHVIAMLRRRSPSGAADQRGGCRE